MNIKNPTQFLFIIAACITIIGAFAKLYDLLFAPYVFALGAGLIIFWYGKEAFINKAEDKRLQRLSRIGFINSLFLGVAVYFMFTGSNSWVVMVLIYSLSSFFQSFRGNK
jgi:CDP-diglyceride synthetase